MAYTILFKPAAEKAHSKLSESLQKRILKRIMELADNPRPRGAEKLSGVENRYRIRVGVIYQIEDDQLLVIILDIGHRKDIYRRA